MTETTEETATPTKGKAKTCPACKAELVQHGDENPFKAGAWHCNECGACWQPDLKAQRYA